LFASCTAILVKNLPAWLTSLLPFEKKKLALSRSFLKYLRAIVRALGYLYPIQARDDRDNRESAIEDKTHLRRLSVTLMTPRSVFITSSGNSSRTKVFGAEQRDQLG
jgi:hypothetical protein